MPPSEQASMDYIRYVGEERTALPARR